jgi:hypothetical protein
MTAPPRSRTRRPARLRRHWTLDRIVCHLIWWICILGIPIVAGRH